MNQPNVAAAVIAGLAITATTAAYLVTGAVPDVLALLATTTVGGYLGISIPAPRAGK